MKRLLRRMSVSVAFALIVAASLVPSGYSAHAAKSRTVVSELSFDNGFMLWRKDVEQITVTYSRIPDGSEACQETFDDVWRGKPFNRDVTWPINGLGYLYAVNPEVRGALGAPRGVEQARDAVVTEEPRGRLPSVFNIEVVKGDPLDGPTRIHYTNLVNPGRCLPGTTPLPPVDISEVILPSYSACNSVSAIRAALPFPVPTSPTDYRGQKLAGQIFRGELGPTDFTGADLRGATFDGVTFRWARFDGADLSGSSFLGVKQSSPNAGAVSFVSAKLDATSFDGAEFLGADFTSVTAMGASFAGVRLGYGSTGAHPSDPNAATQFDCADLTGARFDGADLTGTRFRSANLLGTSFSSTTIGSSCLPNEECLGADLLGAHGMTPEQLDGAVNTWGALVPRDVNPRLTMRARVGDPLGRCNISALRLGGLDLTDADFTKFSLESGSRTAGRFNRSRLRNASLQDAWLGYATEFRETDLRCADLTNASWGYIRLLDADLRGSILVGTPKGGGTAGAKGMIMSSLVDGLVGFPQAGLTTGKLNWTAGAVLCPVSPSP